MSEAKKCDMCKALYEPSKEDNHVVVQTGAPGYSTLKIEAYMRLFTSTPWDVTDGAKTIDHCKDCTKGAVRKFMEKFGISERKGTSFQCRIREGKRHTIYFEEGPALSKEDNDVAQNKNRDFFAGFNGKRVRITVEVL